MNGLISLNLKQLLGGSIYYSYLDQVVLSELSRLSDLKQISPESLTGLNQLIAIKGLDVLAPHVQLSDKITLNTREDDGYLALSTLQLTENVAIKNIIKKSSEKENFKAGTENYKAILEVINKTSFSNYVPDLWFVNYKNRVTVTPIFTKKTMGDLLEETKKDPIIRKKLITNVIDDYLSFFDFLNSPNIKQKLNFPKTLSDFGEHFQKNYCDNFNSKMSEYYKKEIAGDLNSACNKIIHGDFYPENILKNGSSSYIDWERASSNGFIEHDLGKLFSHLRISFKEELDLANYVANKTYSSKEERAKSVIRLIRNQINEDLLGAKRYIGRIPKLESDEDKEKYYNMANTSFNFALERMRYLNKEGIISDDFLSETINSAPSIGNYKLKPVEIEKCMGFDYFEKYNPHCLLTQVHTDRGQPLIDVICQDPNESINKIKKKINQMHWLAKLKPLAYAAMATILLSSIWGGWKISEIQSQKKMDQAEIVKWQENYKNRYKRVFSSIYTNLIMSNVSKEFLFSKDDGTLKRLSEKYNLDSLIVQTMPNEFKNPLSGEKLLGNIIDVSKYWGGFISEVTLHNKTNYFNLIDPFTAYSEFYTLRAKTLENNFTINPRKNAELGVQRLVQLIEQEQDLVSALQLFFAPTFYDSDDSRFVSGSPVILGGSLPRSIYLESLNEESKEVAYACIGGIGCESKPNMNGPTGYRVYYVSRPQ